MKFLAAAAVIASVVAVPVQSFAQSDQQIQRTQLKTELAQLEEASHDLNDQLHYPANIQAAQAKVAAQNAAVQASATGYGGVVSGTTGAGTTRHPE
ncbi:DUF4148 domain-containing protein [Paraburkholderia flagellata]|uniref:DUF4148 domain-containing protein n=1 Tax=Paraburkholderia flagellata TaxID=2883241 RepID=UPI001F290241|nr:DUF4148 domain-containing protein [Paraburkholderia flagellata]